MEKGDLTLAAAEKIANTAHVYLRSAKTKAGAAVLRKYSHVVALDELYENAKDFTDLCEKTCNTLIKAEADCCDIAYLTDGDGIDECVCALSKRCVLNYIRGVAPSYSRGYETSFMRLSAYDATNLRPYLDTAVALHITEIDDSYVAGEIKLWLMEYYDADTPVTIALKGKITTVNLCELDRMQGYDYSAELYIAAQNGLYKQTYCFGDLMRIMQKLTAPDGCPWDKAQTHESIRVNMIEEAYEAVDAIDSGNEDAITEELGDVMLQAVFHCDMAKRKGEFTQGDVLTGLCRKLVSRHTHIFGENKAYDPDEALKFWEAAKSEEKSYVSTADKLNRLPENFPALLAAEKVYKKLIKAGVGGFDKFKTSVNSQSAADKNYAKKLFAMVAQMADDGADAEIALNEFVTKIKKKFALAEQNGEISDFFEKL